MNCAPPFPAADSAVMRILTLTSSSLSIVGSSFIIASYLVFPGLRTFPFKLVVYLSISDWFASLAYGLGMIGVKPQVCSTEFFCYVSAQMSQFFDVATFLWISAIAFNVFQVMVRKKGRAVEHYERSYHFFVWGVSLVSMLIPGFIGAFGDAGLWCWITPSHPMTQFFCYYLLLILVFIFNMIVLVWVGLALRNDASSQTNTVTIRLLSYILVFFVIRIWSVTDRIIDYATGQPVLALAMLHSFFSPLQGFCNAVVYGMNRQVLNEWRYSQLYARFCCCRNRAYIDSVQLLHEQHSEHDGIMLKTELSSFKESPSPVVNAAPRQIGILVDDDMQDQGW